MPEHSEARLGALVTAHWFLVLSGLNMAVQRHRITESQNSRGWKGPLWVI